MDVHRQLAAALDRAHDRIREIQRAAREDGDLVRRPWPMILLVTPKGWTGPHAVDGVQVEGTWRAHQVPLAGDPRGRRPPGPARGVDAVLPARGALRRRRAGSWSSRELAPVGVRRMSANPHANGGLLRRPLELPDFRTRAVEVSSPGASVHEATRVLRAVPRRRVRRNADNFRIFGPDETASNRLDAVYEVTDKVFAGEILDVTSTSRTRAGRRDAVRAHLPGLAGGLPADRPARALQLLRGVHPPRRLDAQPARQVAQDDPSTSSGARRSPRSTTCSPRTSGARTTTGSPTRTPASSTTWSTRRPRWSGSTCRRTPTRCSRRCGTAWPASTTSTWWWPASSRRSTGSTPRRPTCTAPAGWASGTGPPRVRGRPGRRARLRRRRPDPRGPRRGGDPARAPARAAGAVRQRRRPDAAPGRARAPARAVRRATSTRSSRPTGR